MSGIFWCEYCKNWINKNSGVIFYYCDNSENENCDGYIICSCNDMYCIELEEFKKCKYCDAKLKQELINIKTK